MSKIKIGKKSMDNPFHIDNTIFKFQGLFDENMFFDEKQDVYKFIKTQAKNYSKIKSYLQTKSPEFKFIEIYIGVRLRSNKKYNSISFILKSNVIDEQEFIWRKYGSICPDGDQNHIYYRNKNNVDKFKTSSI